MSGNEIYGNNLVNNIPQVWVDTGTTGNIFTDPRLGGNFWSDHSSCADLNSDGFCDAGINDDSAPLIAPFDEPNATSDFDSDGIFADVDVLPIDTSAAFSDGSTSGAIDDLGGQSLTIGDADDPLDGVRIQATGPAGDPATVSVIGDAGVLSLDGGDDVIVTFGSVELEVIVGPVEATLLGTGGGEATVTLLAGQGLTFDPDSFAVTAFESQDQITVFVGDTGFPVTAGDTVLLITDSTPPIIDPTISPEPNASGWNKADVTVTWDLIDLESGIESFSGCDPPGINEENDGDLITCTATKGWRWSGRLAIRNR